MGLITIDTINRKTGGGGDLSRLIRSTKKLIEMVAIYKINSKPCRIFDALIRFTANLVGFIAINKFNGKTCGNDRH